MNTRRWISDGTWPRGIGFASVPVFLLAAIVTVPQSLALDRMAILQQERARFIQIQKWAARTKASVQQIWKEWYRPLAAANQRDFVKNQRIAALYLRKAEEARRKMQDKPAKRYALGAQLFQYYALQNKQVVEAYKKGDEAALRKACAEIIKVEGRIQQVLRTKVDRDWLTPQEIERLTAGMTASAQGTTPGRVGP